MLMSNIPVIIVLFSLSWIVGMGIYSVYSDCDPLASGYTKSADAILPFYIEDKYSFIPGLMGIFLSTLFNSALILNVSNLNSLATVTWEDFMSHLPQFKGMEDKKQLQIIKFIGSIYGLMIMGVGFLVQLLSGVIESAQLMTSATSGPLLGESKFPTRVSFMLKDFPSPSGVFLLAILVPFANWKGASAGMIVSHVIILFVTFGHLTLENTVEFLETSVAGCTNESFSSSIVKPASEMLLSLTQTKPIEVSSWMERQSVLETTQSTPVDTSSFPQNVFAISYMYYSLFGTMITVLVGMVVSLLTLSEADAYDSKYIHPMVYRMVKWFPSSEKLFSTEHAGTDIKNSSLKEPIEQHFNAAFDCKSEEISSRNDAFKEAEANSPSFKSSNLVYKSELEIPRLENYKKLSEDKNLP
jgi:solute carrier family 5 (sodium-coupled monocarboxylate transporter), member 8/12